MKKLASAIAAVALIGTPAFAADMARKMPVKAPPPVPAPVYSWTGWYVGGNVGYSWGKSNNTWNVFAPNLGTPTCGLSLCVTGNDSNHLNGAIGGIEIGYNWQVANYLFGVETDIQLSGQKGSQTFNGSTGPIPLTTVAAVPMTAAYTEKLPWFGTLRGRIGVVSDRALFYATGGLAYGAVKMNGSATISGTNTPGPPPTCSATSICPLANWSNDATSVGFTVGGGVEGVLAYNWTWKIEYLHIDLGNVTTTFATSPVCFGGPVLGGFICSPAGAGTGTINSRVTDEIIRVGLNYQFH